MARKARIKRIIKIPREYLEAIPLANVLFPSLYQFENGLRLLIHNFMVEFYGEDWWTVSLQNHLPGIFNYAAELKTKMDAMPWIGASARVNVLPVHLITLGQLEEIVKKYRADCIPELFPSLEFFLGHMEVIKRVRNLYSHMFPCITREDCRVAGSEIRTLAIHINAKLAQLASHPQS